MRTAIRSETPKITVQDKQMPCPLDQVRREFRMPAPNLLWVSDFAYAATWKGFVHVAFVIDAYDTFADVAGRLPMFIEQVRNSK